MQNAIKSLENNALTALTQRAPEGIVNAIKQASAKTGVSFSYLMDKAAAESNFNPTVKAKTSSATGLFQFIDSTWMDMIDRHGDKHGIKTDQNRQDLLNLRKDPTIASVMAAEFASDNKSYLEKTVGGDVGETELYFAHFMGAGGASAFLNQLKQNPNELAAHIFPKEARANRNVFYDSKTGNERTLQQVYNFFDKKFENDNHISDVYVTETQVASKNKKGNQAGYQHIPFSLKTPTTILPMRSSDNISNSLQAFFSPTSSNHTAKTNSIFPTDFYGHLTDPTSMLLSILRDTK